MNKIENGRSMVEMLGVLAIIGILSVAGIYGYTLAMRKYQANEIIQTGTILAVMASSMNQGEGGCASLETAKLPKPAGINLQMVADATVANSPPSVSVIFSEEREELCNLIAKNENSYTIECNTEPTCGDSE